MNRYSCLILLATVATSMLSAQTLLHTENGVPWGLFDGPPNLIFFFYIDD